MAKIDVYNLKGDITGQIELNDAIFGVEARPDIVHMVVRQQLANKRQGTSKVKGRSEVRGGGRKPWRQKGTGRARQGSIRSAQWVGGGIIFGPTPRSYRFSVPKKVRRLALKSVLSAKLTETNLKVVENLTFESVKTKAFVEVMKNLNLNGKVLVVDSGANRELMLSARNIPNVSTVEVNSINVYDILRHETLLMTTAAVTKLQEVFC